MEKPVCKDCRHYLQHYAMKNGRIFRVFCGHCTQNVVRKKMPATPACDRFVRGEPDECAFADKEYLSKELLQYILKLELLPEIDEMTEPQKVSVE